MLVSEVLHTLLHTEEMLANRRKDQLAVHQPMLDITRKNVIR
jgi:hypothetical protein